MDTGETTFREKIASINEYVSLSSIINDELVESQSDSGSYNDVGLGNHKIFKLKNEDSTAMHFISVDVQTFDQKNREGLTVVYLRESTAYIKKLIQ